MNHAYSIRSPRSLPWSWRLRRVKLDTDTSSYLHRGDLLVQFWDELRLQRRYLRRRRGQLLAFLREPHELRWFLSGLVQPELY